MINILFMRLFASFLMVLVASMAFGQEGLGSQTQREMYQVAKLDYERSDQVLNDSYGRIVSRLGQEDVSRLRITQRAWLKYRDAHCEAAVYGYRGGSMESLLQYECLRVITEQRVEALERFYPDQ